MPTFNNIDLNLLRVFQAIADERSLTLAGDRLHLSQPAVSYALRRLRVIFDDPLFIRTKSGMQPTASALELAKPISRALQSVQEALSYAEQFDPATSTRVFRASMTDAGEMFFLPPMCEYLHAHAPHTRLQVAQMPSTTMEESLRTGQIDFAIGNLPALRAFTSHSRLFEEGYVCMTRKRPGLPARSQLAMHEFLALSHVLVQSAVSSHQPLEEMFRARGVHRKIALDIHHFSVLPRILARTDLAATLPFRIAHMLNDGGQFMIYELPVALPTAEVMLHWHPDFENDTGHRWLREVVTDLLRDYGRSALDGVLST